MSSIIKGITGEQTVTKTQPEVSVPGYGTMPLDMLKRHVQSLSKEFNDSIQQGEFLKAAYRTEQFYNALMALAKALKQQPQLEECGVGYELNPHVAETTSTGTTAGSAGIGGGAGLGIDKSPIEKVLEKPLGEDKELSVEQLATISDEALDKAYGYGRSSPGNTFGWQANLMSAQYAKKLIDSGVTDIEKISDAIHKGWNVTAQKFVQDPDQFSDTEKLRQAGKLDAKLQQRAKLMRINYPQLDNEEQEKDRVVARALLQAIKGLKSVEEGLSKPKVLFNPKPMKKGEGNSPDDYEYTDYIPRGKEDKEARAIKRTVLKQKLKPKKPKELDTGFYKNYLGNRPVREGEVVSLQARKTPLVVANPQDGQSMNDVDVEIKDLRTGKIVASVIGSNSTGGSQGQYEIRIARQGVPERMPPSFVAYGDPRLDDQDHKIFALGPPADRKIEKSPGPGGTTKLRPDTMDVLGSFKGTYYGYTLIPVSEGEDIWTFIEKELGAKLMDDDTAEELGYVEVDNDGTMRFADPENISETLPTSPGGMGQSYRKFKSKPAGVTEGGFSDPDNPEIGDMVKHRNGVIGKVKKIGTQGDQTWIYFKDKNGEMNFGLWKKHVFPVEKADVAEEQAPMFTPEEKIVNMNDPGSDGWRVYKAKSAGTKESSIMKGIQSEGK